MINTEKLFNRIFWRNLPQKVTALGETLLNRIDIALNAIDDRVIEMDATKLSVEVANSMVKSFSLNDKTGVITVTLLNGTVYTWDLNIEKIPVRLSMTADAVLILETEDGEAYEADLKGLIDTYLFDDSEALAFSVTQQEDGKHVTAEIKKGSITGEYLDPDYLAQMQKDMLNAQGQAELAAGYALQAKGWAVGNGEALYQDNNAKHYAEQAQKAAELAQSTVDLNLPEFWVDFETGNLMATFDKPFNFYISEDGDLMYETIGG